MSTAHDMQPDTQEHVAAEVRAAMGRKRISGLQLARACGLTQSAMSRRITGHTPFDVNEIAAVAAELGVEVGSLFPPRAVEPAVTRRERANVVPIHRAAGRRGTHGTRRGRRTA